MSPDHAEEEGAERIDDAIPSDGYQRLPLVGLGASAGGIQALQAFFKAVPERPGMAFVVVLHLSPDHESTLSHVLQRVTKLPVRQAADSQLVEADTVYVIPPGKGIATVDDRLVLRDQAPLQGGRHVAVDLFLRTLADTHGPHAAAVVLSGADSDGAIGIKRIKERGGLTVCQDPSEAEHGSMPRASIDTGMVDWVLPAAEIPARLAHYFGIEKKLQLPPEEAPVQPAAAAGEALLRDVLAFLRSRTGRDFSVYKRATVLRRIGRRMQVNGVHDLAAYLDCLRTRHGETNALLQDLLISVTNFFRDAECFAALEAQLADLFRGKGPGDAVRVWVPACATGEEAYSIAMMLAEQARELEAPPAVQVFGTDLDEQAIRGAREGVYPLTIEADVSEERLRRFFVRDLHGYHVRRELRELVLFAQHDLLKDAPFSRVDLISCRNVLIYLGRPAQRRVFETLHYALVTGGRLFLGASETTEEGAGLFQVLDKKHRIFAAQPVPRVAMAPPALPDTAGVARALQQHAPRVPVIAASALEWMPNRSTGATAPGRHVSWGELHLKLLEIVAPPSVLVDADQNILHMSASAGRLMQFAGGEPSANLLRVIRPELRIELRAALLHASERGERAEAVAGPLELEGKPVDVAMRVVPMRELGQGLYVVTFTWSSHDAEQAPGTPQADVGPAAQQLERELERVKGQLRETVEQYEASTEELKANNEELQAMNEELRSATEELETSREELQSINEELITVNQELKAKVDELALANSDMHNLMNATEIATVFLDRGLCITRYTPSAVSLFNLIASDIGRPLADLATRLDYPQLSQDANNVLARLVPIEREVGLLEDRWFLARLLPYRTAEDRIAGVVLSFIDITERKQAEEVRLWLSAVVASSMDAIISFSTDQTILSWNTGAERIFGYTAAEAIGKPLALVAPHGTAGQQVFARVLDEVRAARPISNLDALGRCKDGHEIHVALSVSPIKDGRDTVIGGTAIARDVTEQKRAAEALRSSEERLRLVVENATEFAIFSMDLQRRVTIWNSGAERLLGYSEAEVTGQTADIIFTEEDRRAGAAEQEMRTAVAQDRAADERVHQRKDGSRFWASGALMLMRDGDGRPVGFVKILRDQTAARDAQVALERSQTDLLRVLAENEASRAELQSADAAKDRFLAVLSHELRNPLASIDSAAALLQTASLPQRDRDAAANVVKRQASTMKSLLDELLDVSRLKLGRLELHCEDVLLNSVVASALETTRSMLDTAGHRLQLDLPEQPVAFHADPLRLGQVLSNLLTNAIKYTPAGGTITVRARFDDGQAVIAVQDTGVGIEPAQIGHMFEMFAQAQPTGDRTHGLGIGLALVKNIVELHGGSVEASSAGLGKGSEFRIILPAKLAPPAPAATHAPPPSEPARSAKKRGLILIADDNLDAGWGIARLLEIAGFATLRVNGGVEAVKETRKHKPDVAIIDIGMPDLNGHEVARQIRQSEWGKHMVLIAATGWGQESDERAAQEAGFDTHMTKPVDLRKLSATVDDLLARKRR